MKSEVPPAVPGPVPQHVAIIMDGNGRWAKKRGQPRAAGHRAGVRVVREMVRACHQYGVRTLTLFAFSQENWQRPETEVKLLMQLFLHTLSREIDELHANRIRLRFIGMHDDLPRDLRELIHEAEQRTAANDALDLVVAVGYGGKWDIARAAAAAAADGEAITAGAIEKRLSTADLPHPDLLIRTGGERRISNFLLWQLAYTELYFCDTLWPDFSAIDFENALLWFAGRDRRFGRIAESV